MEARAGREVILCAGAVATPQLLELSGIGKPEILQTHGIAVQHASPAVGENFRDHLNARIVWRVKDPRVSYNHKARGLGSVGQALRYMTTRGGFFSLPSAPLLAFLKTRPELATPDVQMHLVPYSIKDPKQRKLQDFPSMTVSCYQLRPESLGSIHIRSADPNAQPAIRFNFLADSIDQRAMVDGFRMIRRLVEAKPMDALRGEEYSPGTGVKSDERDPGLDPRQLADRLPPDRHLPHGAGGAQDGGRRAAQGARARGPAHRRRLDLPDHAVWQHQRALHHGRREVRRPAPQRGVATSSPRRRGRRKPRLD